MRVLVVEDDPSIQRMLYRLLVRMFGEDTIPCVTARASLAIVFLRDAVVDKPFDLIISDWNLEDDLTGGDVLEWIRTHASQLERRFLFLSANEEAQKQGVRFVEKPCDSNTLRAAIEAVVAQQ